MTNAHTTPAELDELATYVSKTAVKPAAHIHDFALDPAERSSAAARIPVGLDRLHDPTWLSAMYVDARSSIHRISCVLGVSDELVKTALVTFGIELRTQPGTQPRFPKLHDLDYLYDAFVVRRLFNREVAREVGCAEQTINDAIHRPDVAKMLKDANWPECGARNRPRSQRSTLIPLPTPQEIVAAIREVAGDGWVGDNTLRDQMGLTDGQYKSFRAHCAKLAKAGVFEQGLVKFHAKGRAAIAYRLYPTR